MRHQKIWLGQRRFKNTLFWGKQWFLAQWCGFDMGLSHQQEAYRSDFFAHTTQPLLSKTQWRRDALGLREGVAICRTAFSRRCKNGKRGNNLFIRQASSRHLFRTSALTVYWPETSLGGRCLGIKPRISKIGTSGNNIANTRIEVFSSSRTKSPIAPILRLSSSNIEACFSSCNQKR